MRLRILCIVALASCLSACFNASTVREVPPNESPSTPAATTSKCPDCGRVERIEATQVATPARNSGAVLGGVVGGVVGGTTTGGSTSKPTMKTSYRIGVQMDDGRRLVIVQAVVSPNLRQGSKVRVINGRVVLLR